jgi:hypothetical protein
MGIFPGVSISTPPRGPSLDAGGWGGARHARAAASRVARRQSGPIARRHAIAAPRFTPRRPTPCCRDRRADHAARGGALVQPCAPLSWHDWSTIGRCSATRRMVAEREWLGAAIAAGVGRKPEASAPARKLQRLASGQSPAARAGSVAPRETKVDVDASGRADRVSHARQDSAA